jgi:hypothetical protein
MTREQPRVPANEQAAPSEGAYLPQGLTQEQLADLANPDRQRELRAAYLLQLKRLACPGCGEDDFIF